MPTDKPTELLARFGLSEFRPGQRDVIDAVLAGHDCLCIMPTGGGKSLCYQVPAIAREGLTIVVSPLIALMKDQVDSLQRLGIRADLINSTLSNEEQTARLSQLAAGAYDLIYVAPERFRNPRFLEALHNAKVELLAVDEAHCISEWGHDFRHDYARLGTFRRRLGNPQTIALTATATNDVRDDVGKQLNLRDPRVFIAGFARPNLRYRCQQRETKADKVTALTDYLRGQDGAGIIYASTRKGCEEIAANLQQMLRRKALVYHGGMLPDERRAIQEEFMSGRTNLIVATNAFGMGIDKPDVRFVIHFNIPGTLEAYYQEAGRAGRDGDPSDCLLLYSSRDRYLQEFFIESAHPPRETIAAVYEYLRGQQSDPVELTQDELKEALSLSIGTEGVGTCERLLEKAGVLERLEPNRNMAAVRIDTDATPLVDILPPQARSQRKVMRAVDQLIGVRRFERVYFRPADMAKATGLDSAALHRALRELTKLDVFDYVPPFRGRAVHMLRRDLPFSQLDIDFSEIDLRRNACLAKLDRVIQYALSEGCRQLEILGYFGDDSVDLCGSCDNCRRLGESARAGTSATTSASEIVVAVRMVLSGVARTNGRFGASLIAAMLCGSNSAKVTKWKLDQLSTFGLLSFLTQTEVTKFIKSIVAAQLLEQSDIDRFRPILKMTALGRQVMVGDTELPPLVVPRAILAKIVANHIEKAAAPPTERSSVKPSVVELQQTSPAGNDESDSSQPPPRAVVADGDDSIRPSHYWTWRLLHDGYSLDDCISIRRIKRSTALDHIVRACEEGLPTEISWVADTTQLAELERLVDRAGGQEVAYHQVPDGLHYQQIQLFLKLIRGASESAPSGA